MVFKPEIDEYDLMTLIALGNQTNDEFLHNKIKIIIIGKVLEYDYPMFYLINKFRNSQMILKEVYADVILMKMKDNDYLIEEDLVDEILKNASYDALMCYGADSKIYEFNIKCKEEFYRRGYEIEDKIELQRKRNQEKKKIFKLGYKKKGDKK